MRLVSGRPETSAAEPLRSLFRQTPLTRHQDEHHIHLVFAGSQGRHRLSIHVDDGTEEPALLTPLDLMAEVRQEAGRRFIDFIGGGRCGAPVAALWPGSMRRRRYSLFLRALDGAAEGASRRDIAFHLLDGRVRNLRAAEWKASSTRRRVFRLLDTARALRDSGYKTLLQGGPDLP